MLRGQERCSKRTTLQASVRTALSSEQTSVVLSAKIKKIIVGGNSSPSSF